jgi:tRNA-dihydrouridine synthase C
VDLNFGCPAKVVNRHGGGAALLEDPELLFKIMQAVRRAVPAHQVVSAKMRLGFHDDRRAEDCARALEAGGAGEIVVHARTRADAYRPPAYWNRVADIAAVVKTPLVANGEIWTVQDAQACRAASGCHAIMLGRGIVTYPGLALAIKSTHPSEIAAGEFLSWESLQPHLHTFWSVVRNTLERRQQAGRLKQWLNFLRHHYPQAQAAYDALKAVNDVQVIDAWVKDVSPRMSAFAHPNPERPIEAGLPL